MDGALTVACFVGSMFLFLTDQSLALCVQGLPDLMHMFVQDFPGQLVCATSVLRGASVAVETKLLQERGAASPMRFPNRILLTAAHPDGANESTGTVGKPCFFKDEGGTDPHLGFPCRFPSDSRKSRWCDRVDRHSWKAAHLRR